METFWFVYYWVRDFLDHWQTLMTGIAAFIGAWITVRGIRSQIKQTVDYEKEQLCREERAARAVLPMALSEVAQYAVDCVKLLEPFVPVTGTAPQVPIGIAVPRIPDGILGPMQASVKFADAKVAENTAAVLRWLQTQHSRLEGLIARASQRIGKDIWKAEAVGAIIDAAELHALCARVFPYSRGKEPDPDFSFEKQLQLALFLAGIVDVDNPDLAAAIKRRPNPHTFDLPKL